jgi:hypothetical protein
MNLLFGFFLRLFFCFVGAKFLLHAVGAESRGYLLGLTGLLLINVYWLGYLVFRDRGAEKLLSPAPRLRWEKKDKGPGEPSP